MKDEKIHCRNCKFYKKVWHPRPGVNWDRCKTETNEDGDLLLCASFNSNNDCERFKKKLIPSFDIKIYWWKRYY